MRYDSHEPEVRAILDLARAARKLVELFPEKSLYDLIQGLNVQASQWGLNFVEIIMAYEARDERHANFWKKWKRWRNRREFIKQIPRPNAVYVGRGVPPAGVKPPRKSRKRR